MSFASAWALRSAAALEALEAEFDFIFLGVGLGAMQRLNIPGEDAEGVMNALEFIAGYKTGPSRELPGRWWWWARETPPSMRPTRRAAWARRRSICSTAAARATSPRSTLSTNTPSRRACSFSGVGSRWRIRADEHGRLLLDTVQVQQVDSKLLPIPDSEFTIDCDLVVPAIGQSPLTQLMQELRGVEVRDGRIVADRATGQTTNPRYFAGGDCVNGGREVVDAVADGKRAALGDAEDLRRPRMPDIHVRKFAGSIDSPNPFWLASAPPTNCGEQIMRAFDAGWGGAVWKTIGEPVTNVSSRYSSIDWNGQRMMGFNNIELISDRSVEDQSARDRRGEEALSAARGDRVADGGVEARGLARDCGARRGCGRRRARTELRLPARHERARHGLGRRPGAGVCAR